MGGPGFDNLTRTLSTAGSRRRAVATAAGVLGMLRLASVKAAQSGLCKPACDECNTCKKGRCTKKNGRKSCKKGRCEPKLNNSPCKGTGRCLAGTCNLPPVCTQALGNCSVGNSGACCSDDCVDLGNRAICAAGAPGKECLANTDCTSNRCIGFRCQ